MVYLKTPIRSQMDYRWVNSNVMFQSCQIYKGWRGMWKQSTRKREKYILPTTELTSGWQNEDKSGSHLYHDYSYIRILVTHNILILWHAVASVLTLFFSTAFAIIWHKQLHLFYLFWVPPPPQQDVNCIMEGFLSFFFKSVLLLL